MVTNQYDDNFMELSNIGNRSVKRLRADSFDNLEFLSAERMTHSFPLHFHDEYSIGVAISGLQQFEVAGSSYIVQPASLLLMPAREMHAHHSLNELGWDYKNMYFSPDLLDYCLRRTGFDGSGRESTLVRTTLLQKPVTPFLLDKDLYEAYLRLHEQGMSASQEEVEQLIGRVFRRVYTTMTMDEPERPAVQKLEEICEWISAHYTDKLHLDGLAARFSMDKYQLIRQFKKHTGVTPNTWLTILRVEKARLRIREQAPIVEAALDAGFYDQSHFHHSFLYYTGLTPGAYRRRNILQD